MPSISQNAILISTDGGFQQGGSAASCIISFSNTVKIKLVAAIHTTRSSDAEACGGALGFFATSLLHAKLKPSLRREIVWQSDNKAALACASNQKLQCTREESGFVTLLRMAIVTITNDFQITPQYIPGHSGNRTNEQCDRACRWICEKGQVLLSQCGENFIGQESKKASQNAWYLLDLRDISFEHEEFVAALDLKLSLFLSRAHIASAQS